MDSLINFAILRNPVNWLIVITILVFVSFAGFTVWNASKNGLAIGNL